MSSPPAAPSRSPLTRIFPTARATISSPLPPDEVRRRLLGPDEQEWQIGEGGLAGSSRRYNVQARSGGRSFAIDGPDGPKRIRLATEATVQPAGDGTSLELKSWISSMVVLLMAAGLICLALAPLVLRFAVSWPPLVLAVVFYGACLIGLKSEAYLIKDHCARRLGDG